MRYAVLFTLLAVVGLADQPRKPACNPSNQGRFWPEEANYDRNAARDLTQKGELQICSLAVWKYRWEPLSVNARTLAKGKGGAGIQPAKPAGGRLP